jgi:hypothetical protein
MSIPVLVRSVGPEPSAGYYTQWTTFVPGYPKFKNADTGVSQAFYAPDGVTLTAYRAHYLYFTGQTGEIVDRTVEFDVGLIPGVGEYYDIPVTGYQTGGTGLNPNPGSSSGTAQPSGPARLDITVSESFALSTTDAKVTPWHTPHFVQQTKTGTNDWTNMDGAQTKEDGVSASKAIEAVAGYKLACHDFRFSLPSSAKVAGVEVEALRNGYDAAITSEVVDLVLGMKQTGGGGWDISTAVYSGKSIHITELFGTGMAFKPDGTKLVVGIMLTSPNRIGLKQYDLSTPWDISTASFTSTADVIGGSNNYTTALAFSTDGAKMYVVGNDERYVRQYSLSTPWSVGTATYDSVAFNASIGSDGGFSDGGIFFTPDGLNMYTCAGAKVRHFALASAWDLATASLFAGPVPLGGITSNASGIYISGDGTVLFVSSYADYTVHSYILAVPFDITSASTSAVFDTTSQTGSSPVLLTDIQFSPDGTRLYTSTGNGNFGTNENIYQYDVSGETLELGPNQILTDGYSLPDGSTYVYDTTELFNGTADPEPALSPRPFFSGGQDATGGWTLTGEEVNRVSFGALYTALGSAGLVAVDSVRMRIHYRADPTTDTLPAKRSAGLAGVAESPSGVKVAVGVDGKILRKPANNPTWTSVASGTTVSLNAVEWVGDRFVAVGMFGMALDGGADGSAWTRIDTGAVSSLWAIKRVPNTLRAVAVGNDDYSFERGRQGSWTV